MRPIPSPLRSGVPAAAGGAEDRPADPGNGRHRGPLAWLWQASRVPAVYSVMDMGYLDYGGGAAPDPSGGHGDTCKATFTATTRPLRAWSPTWSPIRHDPQTYGSTW